MAAGTDTFLQVWDGLQAYTFPPFALIRQVLNKLTSSKGTFLTLITPFWPQKEWFPELQSLTVAPPVSLSFTSRLTQTAPLSSSTSEPPRAESSCDCSAVCVPLKAVSACSDSALPLSAPVDLPAYQHRWECYRSCCFSRGHSVSSRVPKYRVFKLDTTEISERTLILPICGFHTFTVYGLLLTRKIKVQCANVRSSASWIVLHENVCLHPIFE